ncbi:MAG TPA: hypothetical protein VGF84_13760, partial [Micromonosporaceae bacterium]
MARSDGVGQIVILNGPPRSGKSRVPDPVGPWHREVHTPGIYDLQVDTSALSPQECADLIARRLEDGPPGSAFGSEKPPA